MNYVTRVSSTANGDDKWKTAAEVVCKDEIVEKWRLITKRAIDDERRGESWEMLS